ncbi:MAG: dockerin type I repeat-containing protein [candidate division Zixibacteria bacterium]|nr:dockerin type I repeat-containing protein [candidate division Zixibacteria bacterium]
MAVFYIYRYNSPDESAPGQNDTLIEQQPVYILNSAFGNAATDFGNISLSYHYNNPMGEFRDSRYVYFISYQVRWYGTRDIYIDQVNVSDVFGRQLWEPSDTVVGFPNLRDQAAAYYGNSPTILGWYLVDDQSMAEDRDNVLSGRRVDSLLGAWYPGKKGFVVTGAGGADYISLAGYSNISFQWFPIFKDIGTASQQIAWDYKIPELANMKELALAKGVPCYPLIQGFEGENGVTGDRGWRRPTAEEHLCMVNLVLAYGANGIWYWKYYGTDASLEKYTDGLVYSGDIFADTTTTWSEIKNTIGPYIEKMGPIFASLEWQDAKKYTSGLYSQFHLIDSISCNQYSGYNLHLQVAYFHNPGDEARYYMLVNRRCLPTETVTGRVFLQDRQTLVNVSESDTVAQEPNEPCPPPPCPDRWWVTDMETGNSWQCTRSVGYDCKPQYFNYVVAPGAAKLYRISPTVPCHHGDANDDGNIDISDAVFLISYIFSGGLAPDPLAAGDANCDGGVDISDAVFLISYIFSGGLAPCGGCY